MRIHIYFLFIMKAIILLRYRERKENKQRKEIATQIFGFYNYRTHPYVRVRGGVPRSTTPFQEISTP